MRLDGTDLAFADGATNRTSLLVLQSRPRLVPEIYSPTGYTLRRPDAGEGTLDLEFGRPYYTRVRQVELNRVRIFIKDDRLQPCRFKIDRLYCTLNLRKRRWGLEINDQKNKRWVPYVPDYNKWEQHFTDVSEGRARADHRGQYLVGSGARRRPHTLKVEQTLLKSNW